jgi:molybdenum cofactor synthesis domain-containing protein
VNAEIIAVGSELLTPHRQDTNSLYLTEKLNDLGVEVRFKCIVGDDAEGLTAAAKLAMRRSDIIIFSGGLGPTEDDLTREAVADALGLETAARSRNHREARRALRQARLQDVAQQCQAGRHSDQRHGVAESAGHRARPVDRRKI